MTVAELKKKAKELKVKNWWLMTKAELEACVNVFTAEGEMNKRLGVVNTINSDQIIVTSIPQVQLVAATISEEQLNSKIDSSTPKQGKHESVEDFIARGGKITELPSPVFPAPKPTRESSAMKPTPKPEKKAPRRISKPTLSEQGKTKEKRVPRKVVKTEVKGDTVTLSSLVEASGIEARIARRRLRNSDIEKPGAQWEWPIGHEDIAKVKELLK